jgi:dephospho-CoA kinase
MIIGICGLIGAGKDTAADYLVNFHGFRRDSFAATLKDAVAAVFGWNRDWLEGRTKASREWREQADLWWSQRLGMEITPRWILQNWGTEVCRNGFHKDIWIASLENKLRQTKDNVVISDCRFFNEVDAIRNLGGRIVWIQRGPTPHWYDIAARANRGDTKAQQWLKNEGIHASETSWAGTYFDLIIANDGMIDDLYQQLNGLLEDHLPAKDLAVV